MTIEQFFLTNTAGVFLRTFPANIRTLPSGNGRLKPAERSASGRGLPERREVGNQWPQRTANQPNRNVVPETTNADMCPRPRPCSPSQAGPPQPFTREGPRTAVHRDGTVHCRDRGLHWVPTARIQRPSRPGSVPAPGCISGYAPPASGRSAKVSAASIRTTSVSASRSAAPLRNACR